VSNTCNITTSPEILEAFALVTGVALKELSSRFTDIRYMIE
jgi:hypothetical protein